MKRMPMISPKKRKDKRQTSPVTPPDSPSFQEPETPEDQTAYSLAIGSSSRKGRSRITKTQPDKPQKQLAREKSATLRSDSSSYSSDNVFKSPAVPKKNPTSVLQPKNKTNSQRPGTSSQRDNSTDSSGSDRTPSPKKRGNKQNIENISPQPGTSRGVRPAADNRNPQPGSSRGARPATDIRNPQPGTSRGARPAADNINPQPGTSRVKKTAPVPPGNRRKQKTPIKKGGVQCLKDIYRLQSSTSNLIPKLPFSRLIREILHATSFTVTRLTPPALIALQETTEIYLTHLFADAYRCTLHRDRVTLSVKDIQLTRYLRGAPES